MKNKVINSFTYLAAAIFFIVGPHTLFKVCEVKDVPMKCYLSTRAEIGIAILFIFLTVLYFFTNTVREKVLVSILGIATSVVAILIPSVFIGGCSMVSMPCQRLTFPAFYSVSILVIVISLINICLVTRKA